MVKYFFFQRMCMCILLQSHTGYSDISCNGSCCAGELHLFSRANRPAQWDTPVCYQDLGQGRNMVPCGFWAASEDGGLAISSYSQTHAVLLPEMTCVSVLGLILCVWVYLCQRSTFLWKKNVSKMKFKSSLWRKGQEFVLGLCWGKVTQRNRLKEN